jgi:class 3 adenylate cyclase/predicted Ser/Thr protein kinase
MRGETGRADVLPYRDEHRPRPVVFVPEPAVQELDMSEPHEPAVPGLPTDAVPQNKTAATTPPTHPDTTPTFEFRPRAEPPTLPDPFGRYQIVRPLGRGGMGTVYLARDTQLDRLVALKVPQFEVGDPLVLRERFYREARAAALLHHPNICPVFDVGAVGDIPYLTMAYIDGQPLQEWAALPRPAAERVALVRTLALALEEAHRKGVIHRDLKPSNILIDRRGEPVVMDFGLARRLHLPGEERLTTPGLLMGTPAYMPPEHVLGQTESPGPAGDVYALGVILYELLTGRCPYLGPVTAVLAQVLSDMPLPPSQVRPELGVRYDAVCLRALAKKPEERFASMADLAEALERCLVGGQAASLPASGGRPAACPTEPDPRLAAKVLGILRTWGWARGLQKIRTKAQRAEPERQRSAWQGFLDWLGGERDEARTGPAFATLPGGKALRGWALAGRASFLLRRRDYPEALRQLERAEAEGDPADRPLQATIAHTRASALVHQGKHDQALPLLHRALDLFGKEHFVTGRVLDTLGMAYAYKGNFPVAREFYEQSIRYKEACGDEAGIAISHGQLGRLYLDWGHLDEAEHHFQEDLRLAQKIRSRWSEAQIYNHLGQVALARGQREAAAGRRAAARRRWAEAAGWLDESIRHCQEEGYGVSEGFARKDRALVCLHEGDLDGAEAQARQAEALFEANDFAEGQAKVQLVEGMLLRGRQRWPEAERRFRSALGYFEATQESDEAVQAHWEIARTLRDSGTAAPLVTRAYREALARAEASRCAPLVAAIEAELREVDFEAYLRHVYRRARGDDIDDDSPTLLAGTSEVLTVLFLDLPGFTDFAHGRDPEAVLLTFNSLMADLTAVLERYRARVTTYRGNGLMALVRDARHAERGVSAALDLVAALEEFNRPRRLLGLPVFHVRIGVNSGEALLGNVGTYHKMDFSAIGTAVNLAGSLRNEAEPGLPCVSRATYEQVRERFAWKPGGPRTVTLTGFGPVDIWDVTGRK